MKSSHHDLFAKYRTDVFSQNGEDGIIEAILNQIPITHKFVFECGAANGKTNSCSRNLLIHKNWSGLMIEADITDFERLCKNYQDYPKTTCVNTFISFAGSGSIDEIFKTYQAPNNLDVFVLDIDGNEYHVWESMRDVRPSLMIVEFNPTIPNEVDFVQPRDMSVQQGSSLLALQRLGTTKGYRLVTVTDVNAFFVRNDIATPFLSNSENLADIRPINPFETKLFQLYDGTLKIAGYSRLFWNNIEIDEEKIQVLPPSRRIYLNGINNKAWVRQLKHSVRNSPLYPLVKKIRRIPLFRSIIK